MREAVLICRTAVRNYFCAAPLLFALMSASGEHFLASSAGILMYRQTGPRLEVLLVHPGGPFWRSKDKGAWSIPKGEMAEGEDAAVAARREFHEEMGYDLSGPWSLLVISVSAAASV